MAKLHIKLKPMKYVTEVAGARSEKERAITISYFTQSKILTHMHIFIS